MSRLSTALGLLPSGRIKNRLLTMSGHRVHPTAVVRPVVLLGGTRLEIGPHATVGALTAFRNVRRVVVSAYAEVGQLNWFSAAPFLVEASTSDTAGELIIGTHASVTNRHYFDVSGGVEVRPFATVAGVRSVFMTHGINVDKNALETKPIVVGDHAMVGSTVKLVPGAVVPDRSVIAMGSVVTTGLVETDSFYAGVPATRRRAVERRGYMTRRVGKVPPG